MKKVLLAASIVFALTSCGNSDSSSTNEANTKENAAHDHTGHSHDDGHKHEETTGGQKFTDVDPACGMTREASWDQFSVNGSDTTWFCSPVCKERFDADPAKFSKKS